MNSTDPSPQDHDDAAAVALEPVMEPLSDDNDEDLASLLAKREHARPNRATWALLALIVLAVGFVGGAFAQSKWGTSSSSTGGMPDFSAMSGAATGGQASGVTTGSSGQGSAQSGGQGGFGGGGMTFGTIASVDGNTLTVTDSSGKTITVAVPSSATVTANQEVSLAELAAGDTVIVRGETGDDGTITATSVTEGAGGFPGGGPGGGQAGASSQTSGGRSGGSSTTQPSAAAPQPSTSATPTQGDAS
ncbi:MAG: DUF5666 domain-containing protein [Candidatus Nanopelagicales bacterium]|jgi:hypothetical protein